MKYCNYKLLFLLSVVFIMGEGCKKNFFDTVPDDIPKIEEVFKDKNMSERWLAGVYNPLPQIWGTSSYPFEGMTNDGQYAFFTPALNTGALSPDNSNSYWQSYYQGIRNAGIFIANIDKNEQIKNSSDYNGLERIKQYKGEARFLRAYYYFLLMKLYGPIEILPDVPGDSKADYKIARSPIDTCVKYIVSEMEKAFQEVPDVHYTPNSTTPDEAQLGRVTKAMVLAGESQVLLYAASPLYNGNNEFADFKNLDGTQLINQNYDENKWKIAADAAKAVIETGKFSLYRATDSDPFKAAYLSSRNLFWDGWKQEGIWFVNMSQYNLSEWERSTAPRNSQGEAWNGNGPTQSLVDAFRMADGKAITDAGSKYTESGFSGAKLPYYVNNTSNMYVGREPRFYAYITFSGSTIPTAPRSGETYVGFFNTGNNGKAGAARNWPRAGYTWRKNLHPSTSFGSFKTTPRPSMLIRLAEIYLNYVEALNEYSPGNSDIIKYLNEVRTRGGLPALEGSFSKEEMRKLIHAERRIELCQEGHRYFDVRRWKTAGSADYQGGSVIGMNMDKGTSLTSPEFYQRTIVERRIPWSRKLYFYPAPQDDKDRNPNLVQVPGY